MELLKLLSANQMVGQLLCFFAVFFLLRKFAWRHFLKVLDDRRENIASEFKRIEDAKTELVKIKTEYETKLTTIEDVAEAKIEEAIAEGERAAKEIKEKARQEAQLILGGAKENIQAEIAKAEEELKNKIVDLSLNAAEHIIKAKLSAGHDKKLVEDFVEEMEGLK